MENLNKECEKRTKILLGGLATGALFYVGYKTGFKVCKYQFSKGLEVVFKHCPELEEQMVDAMLETTKERMMK